MLHHHLLIIIQCCIAQEEVRIHTSSSSPLQHSQLSSVSNKSSPQQSPEKFTPEQSKYQLKQPSIYLDSSMDHHKIIFDANKTMTLDQEGGQDVCPLDEPIEQQAESVSSHGSPEKEEEKEEDTSVSSDDNKPQPWELVGDRYAPIRIEQVRYHIIILSLLL